LQGALQRLTLTIHADMGESLTLEATAFAPELDFGVDWASFLIFPDDGPSLYVGGFLFSLAFDISPPSRIITLCVTCCV
jgi:hypothetical protein